MSKLIVEGVPASQTGAVSRMNAIIRTIGGSISAAVMSTIITSEAHRGGLPTVAGYTHGFALLAVAGVIGSLAAFLARSKLRHLSAEGYKPSLPLPELGLVASGTVNGDGPE